MDKRKPMKNSIPFNLKLYKTGQYDCFNEAFGDKIKYLTSSNVYSGTSIVAIGEHGKVYKSLLSGVIFDHVKLVLVPKSMKNLEKPIKDSWTREEVHGLICKAIARFSSTWTVGNVDEWIKQNL